MERYVKPAKHDPRYNVISLRLTDAEKKALVKLAAKRKQRNIGAVIRELIIPLTDLHAEDR
jgi:hypothetical protein